MNGKVQDYRFEDEKRKNIPDAGLASYYKEKRERRHYDYDPHLDPQLIWAGKVEHENLEVDTVALNIHERISTKAILKAVEKKELLKQLKLFGEPDLPLDKRIEFYQHEMDWTNRLVLGDSLLVMNSLLEREMMAGKVQMIFIDPPYGIAYNSNFQPAVSQRDVKDGRDDCLTREIEQIKAYRDTWTLGIHSYLTYLRDRLLLSRELLADTGSVFVQISDENIHHVFELLSEVFGRQNFIALISFRKFGVRAGQFLDSNVDHIIWFAKDKKQAKYHQLYLQTELHPKFLQRISHLELPDGSRRALNKVEKTNLKNLPFGARLFETVRTYRPGGSGEGAFEFQYQGHNYRPPQNMHWATSSGGLGRLAAANRLIAFPSDVRYVRYFDDFPYSRLTTIWDDTWGEQEKLFVVQTSTKVIERCILMTTDPGDLILDPTCGSGTTAHCAEKLGRRWITIDTSRVALFLARQRVLTAVFPYFQLAYPDHGVGAGFVYETVPHVTLESIAKDEGATEETLFDRPKIDKEKIRVSGPFTVEAIPVPSAQEPSIYVAAQTERSDMPFSASGAKDYVDMMINLISRDGITFAGGKRLPLENIRCLESAGFLHAEGQVKQNGNPVRVALSFGPRHGPVTARQVIEAAGSASMMGVPWLIFAGFTFDPEAQATIQKNPHPSLQIHMANIRPDVEMGGLLKSPKGSQLFTVFGQPDIKIQKAGEEYSVELLGVDIYDPTKGEVHPSRPEDVAAWFLDQDYDGYTFCATQAFFPKEATNRNPWDKLENALHGIIAKERMERLRGTKSLPFKAEDQKRIAVKVIDQRGNEVIVVKKLEEAAQG